MNKKLLVMIQDAKSLLAIHGLITPKQSRGIQDKIMNLFEEFEKTKKGNK